MGVNGLEGRRVALPLQLVACAKPSKDDPHSAVLQEQSCSPDAPCGGTLGDSPFLNRRKGNDTGIYS